MVLAAGCICGRLSLWRARHQVSGFTGQGAPAWPRPREQMALSDAEQAEVIAVMKGKNHISCGSSVRPRPH